MASTADFRNGLCIEHNHSIYSIVEFQHVKPGKGPAFVRTKLKNVKTGKVLEKTFTAGHKVTTARIERRPHQYLYKDSLGFHFMNTETYEQLSLEPDFVPNNDLIKDGQQDIALLVHSEKEEILSCELPQFIVLEVTYTEPGLKGDTATNASKPATLETGAEIQVPLFINQGEKLKIDTRTRSYVERIKS